MGRVFTCVGRYAGTPYTIKNAFVKVYSVEELCYYICNNAYIMEEPFFDEELYVWLAEECDLISLAKKLKNNKRHGLSDTVRLFLNEVHYASEKEIDEVCRLIVANRNLSDSKKLKLRADYFLQNNRLALAEEIYLRLLGTVKEGDDMLPAIYHNLGVIYGRLFLYEKAARYFESAYALDEKEEHLIQSLAAKRMYLSETEYLSGLSSIAGGYEASENLEKRLTAIDEAWKKSEGLEHLNSMKRLKSSSITAFYRTMDFHTGLCREDFRTKMIK
ncbi:MAG: tetratricopeptide repeat protein [Lachnospiraceae bacterium]|nr:tetratricopeptide repeat protein [Lachnospiraceae bacterium]